MIIRASAPALEVTVVVVEGVRLLQPPEVVLLLAAIADPFAAPLPLRPSGWQWLLLRRCGTCRPALPSKSFRPLKPPNQLGSFPPTLGLDRLPDQTPDRPDHREAPSEPGLLATLAVCQSEASGEFRVSDLCLAGLHVDARAAGLNSGHVPSSMKVPTCAKSPFFIFGAEVAS